jgi:hypothetical protein
MTRPSPDTLLERRLEESFATAHDDARWEGGSWTDPLVRIRRAGRAHRRRVATASSLSVVALAGGALAAVSAIPASTDRVGVTAPMAGGQTGSGLAWLMSRDRYDAYVAAHPSPSPSTVRVPSPAPVNDELRTLEADMTAALPAGAQTLRADAADGGNAGQVTVWMTLPDGTPVAAERQQLHYPYEDPGYNGASPAPGTTPGTNPDQPPLTEVYTDPTTWSTGTAYEVATGNVWGYGVTDDEGHGRGWHGPFVLAATADGWLTTWTAPVSTDRLLGWARAADAHFVSAH